MQKLAGGKANIYVARKTYFQKSPTVVSSFSMLVAALGAMVELARW